MKKCFLVLGICAVAVSPVISQSLFTCGNNEVGKEEFLKAFSKNMGSTANREASLKEYLELYSAFKMKVSDAKALKLDTIAQIRYDMMNFRSRLENDYTPGIKEVLAKTGFKKNDAINEDMLFLYADSVAYSTEKKNYPIAKETIFSIGNTTVKASDWLAFAKQYKLNKDLYKGESNRELYELYINQTAVAYFKNHLEEYNADFKYEVQEFKEGNLMYEITNRRIWNQSGNDEKALKAYYEANKEHFLWGESADVVLINSKSYAYADYAYENMKKGMDWKSICDNSEGMTQGDLSRYELSQLPIKPGAQLAEGAILEVVKNNFDEGASFVKIIKLYPAKMPRSFEEAKSMVINEYQKKLEENWMKELAVKYPVKINNAVFQSLLK